jgi:hypothetical protein
MTKLSPRAEVALETLRQKHSDYLVAKLNVEIELKQEIAKRLAGIRHERDTALRLASEAGVPKTQLGKAIGTSNYRTVQEIMAQAESVAMADGSETKLEVQRSTIEGQFSVVVGGLGEQRVSGEVLLKIDDEGNLSYIDGDAFVIPQLYRAGFAETVIERIKAFEGN